MFNVHYYLLDGSTSIIPWTTLLSAKQCVDRIRSRGGEAVIDGYCY